MINVRINQTFIKVPVQADNERGLRVSYNISFNIKKGIIQYFSQYRKEILKKRREIHILLQKRLSHQLDDWNGWKKDSSSVLKYLPLKADMLHRWIGEMVVDREKNTLSSELRHCKFSIQLEIPFWKILMAYVRNL